MRISAGNNPLTEIKEIQSKIESKEKLKSKNKPEPGKTVQISDMAAELAGLERDMKDVPDIRQDKVIELKEKIDSGQYEVDLDQLADVLSRFI